MLIVHKLLLLLLLLLLLFLGFASLHNWCRLVYNLWNLMLLIRNILNLEKKEKVRFRYRKKIGIN